MLYCSYHHPYRWYKEATKMSDANLLMLAIGPVSAIVKADRQSKGISEAQLERKWETNRVTDTTQTKTSRQFRVGLSVDWHPTMRVEWKRSSS